MPEQSEIDELRRLVQEQQQEITLLREQLGKYKEKYGSIAL